MKFAVIALIATTVSAATADASLATDAVCTADKECKVATEACCQTYTTKTLQDAKGTDATKKMCKAGITAIQTAVPFMIECKARVAAKGASKLAAGLSAVAAAAGLSAVA